MEKIIILGNGGHANSLVDIIEKEKKYEIVGYIINDDNQGKGSKYPVIGNDMELERIFKSGIRNAAVGIGYLGKSNLRQILWKKLKKIGFFLPVICDDSAILAQNVEFGEGCFIGKGAIINASVRIDKMCIINTGAIIEHDCYVQEFSHISVGSILCGNVNVGEASFIGANATVIQGKKIGNKCIIGAGTVVRENVEDYYMIWDGKKIFNGV